MILTTQERLRFAEYAKAEAESCEQFAKQMENIPHVAVLAKREKSKYAAWTIVALELSARTEEFSVGSEDIGDVP